LLSEENHGCRCEEQQDLWGLNMKLVDTALEWIGHTDRLGIILMRIAIAIVFLWIGALKFAPYEADSITPFVANNPILSLFYKHPEQYKAHLTRVGELVPSQREWQRENNTYGFSNGLGTVEITIGLLVLLWVVSPRIGLVGATLAFLTPFVTLSFLLTTPEAWVPAIGDAQHGFPFLSGGGRLVLKDVMLLAGGMLVMADSARQVRALRLSASRSQNTTAAYPHSA
jgi:reactive chlorine resistance protein C